MTRGGNRMSREAIMAAHERERQIVQLFIRGLAWVEIGRQLGISDNGAKKAFDRAVKRIPPKDVDLLRKMQSERFSDYRRRLFSELAGREKTDPSTQQKMIVKPEIAEVDALVARLAAIDRQEADLYGLNAPKKAEQAISAMVGQPISDEELDRRLARLTHEEKDTLMILNLNVETTATTVRSNGAGSCVRGYLHEG